MGVFRNFPYSNFHEMNMDEIIKIIKNMLEEWATYHAEWNQWMADLEESWSEYQDDVNAQWEAYQNTMNTAWQSMQNFINNYFDNLDVQEEINNKIVHMIQTGEFGMLVNEYIPPAVNAWLNLNITQPSGVVIDTSLSVAGACADAKATGDAIRDSANNIDADITVLKERTFPINQWDEVWELGGFSTDTGVPNAATNMIRSKNFIPVKPNTEYFFKMAFLVYDGAIFQYDSNKIYLGSTYLLNGISNTVFETDENARYIKFETQSAYGTTYNHDISINYPASYKNYYPYTDSKIEVELDNTVHAITGSDISIIRNGFLTSYPQYVNTTGQFVEAESGWKRSDFIEVAEGYSVDASLMGYDSQPIIAYYDEDKNYLPNASVISNDQLVVNVNSIVPNGVKYAVFITQTTHTNAYVNIQSVATISEGAKKLHSEIQTNATTTLTGFNGAETYTGHVATNGDLTLDAQPGWTRTGLIETQEGASCIASLKGYLDFPIVAFYDENKNYLPNKSILSNAQLIVNIDTLVPSGVKYVVFVSQTSYNDAFFSIETSATIGNAVNQINKEIFPYKGVNVACLGDSLTVGLTGNNTQLFTNYPYYMKQSRLKGCHITNYGVAGSTTKTFWDDHKSELTVDPDTDIVLMMWGTNGGLVDPNALSTDVEPYNNYEDYADTGVGCYCKIIEYVMELTQNNAQIILITPPYNGDSSINSRVINAQPVVKQIAERYKIPYIDMFKSGISEWNCITYMPIDSVHFSKEGYEWIGKYIGSCVDAICTKLK